MVVGGFAGNLIHHATTKVRSVLHRVALLGAAIVMIIVASILPTAI